MAWQSCCVLGCLLLQGCAFAEVKIKLDPSPTTASVEGQQREVVVFPSEDQRSDTKSCGARRNMYGADVGRVRCVMEPTQWLNEAVLTGLDRRNFRVVTLTSAKSKSPIELHLALETLFVDEVIEAEQLTMLADVEVRVLARTSNGLLAERNLFVRERQSAPNEGSYQETMLLASRQMSRAVVDAVVELANRYPSLGAIEQPSSARSVP